MWQMTFLSNSKRCLILCIIYAFGYTDDWSAYSRHLDADQHEIGKRNTQKIERQNLNLGTWIKRLTHKAICFSKLEVMHDTVIGLLINKAEFGRNIYLWFRFYPLPPTATRRATAAFLRRVIAGIFWPWIPRRYYRLSNLKPVTCWLTVIIRQLQKPKGLQGAVLARLVACGNWQTITRKLT